MKTAAFLPLVLLRSALKGYYLFLLKKFLIVNVHQMSDKWSYDTFAHFWSVRKARNVIVESDKSIIATEM
jgi:hypothetical protein